MMTTLKDGFKVAMNLIGFAVTFAALGYSGYHYLHWLTTAEPTTPIPMAEGTPADHVYSPLAFNAWPPTATATCTPTASLTPTPSATPTATTTCTPGPPSPTPTPTPPIGEWPTVYDFDGNATDWDWLTSVFGPVQLLDRETPNRIKTMTAQTGPASITVHVEDALGPLADVPVIFYWPDAPSLPEWAWGCGTRADSLLLGLHRGIIGYTNLNGDVGFAMGGGSYYFPPDVGPHCLWLGLGESECVCGLGMIGLTEHDHLNPGFTLLEGLPSFTADPRYVEGTLAISTSVDGAGWITVYALEAHLDEWLDLSGPVK